MKKTFLITGVAGLIGSRLANWILKNVENSCVYGIDDLSGGYHENIPEGVNFFKLNLVNDVKLINELFESTKFDYVFHLAAYAAEGLSPFIRTYNYDNNLRATALIVNNCIQHNVTRLVFTSTLAVYGHGNGSVFDELQTPAPIDPYGVAKYACEMDIQIAGVQHNLDWCIIRPHNVYGEYQNIWDKYRNVIGIWMYQRIHKLPLTIFGDGNQTRAFSYIDDILEPLFKASIEKKASKQIINLGGIKEYSINNIKDIFCDISKSNNVVYLESRHEVKHSIPTYQKSIDILGFKHITEMETGISKMWNWAQLQPSRTRFEWPFFELDNGLYGFWKNK
jgi:UDP-glucose 4-epimerase